MSARLRFFFTLPMLRVLFCYFLFCFFVFSLSVHHIFFCFDTRIAANQATLVECDALCDAVDDAEALLSRGTSLLHKVGDDAPCKGQQQQNIGGRVFLKAAYYCRLCIPRSTPNVVCLV